jgi:hypothetical protein
MSVSVEQLLQQNSARLWRARETGSSAVAAAPAGVPTGYAALDRCLPGAGWPRQGLIEILSDQRGIGELSLLMPSLATLCRSNEYGRDNNSRWLTWVAPPYQPYAPALAAFGIDVRRVLIVHAAVPVEWAMEQALRSEACSAVLGWSNPCDKTVLRRLQLAAEQSRCLAVLFRPVRAAKQPSPAVLRIELKASCEGLQVRIVKSRGGRPVCVTLPRAH